MNKNDLLNALFEFLAALSILNHCRVLYKDKKVAGVSVLSTMFFFSWGIWNLHYYPSLSQWYSFGFGIFVAVANALWIALMLRYRNNR